MCFLKAYLDMVEAMEWTSFVVIYEEPEGLIRLQEVLKMAPKKKGTDIKIKMRQLIGGPGKDYRSRSSSNVV